MQGTDLMSRDTSPGESGALTFCFGEASGTAPGGRASAAAEEVLAPRMSPVGVGPLFPELRPGANGTLVQEDLGTSLATAKRAIDAARIAVDVASRQAASLGLRAEEIYKALGLEPREHGVALPMEYRGNDARVGDTQSSTVVSKRPNARRRHTVRSAIGSGFPVRGAQARPANG